MLMFQIISGLIYHLFIHLFKISTVSTSKGKMWFHTRKFVNGELECGILICEVGIMQKAAMPKHQSPLSRCLLVPILFLQNLSLMHNSAGSIELKMLWFLFIDED